MWGYQSVEVRDSETRVTCTIQCLFPLTHGYHSSVHSDRSTMTSNYGNTVALIVTWAVRSVVNVFSLITHYPALFPNSSFLRHYAVPEMYVWLLHTLVSSNNPGHISFTHTVKATTLQTFNIPWLMTAPVGNKHPLCCQCTSSNGLTVIACITMWGSWWFRRFTTDLKQSFAWTGEFPILSQISIMRPHSSEVFFSSVAFSEIWQDVHQELVNSRTRSGTVDATNCQAQALYGKWKGNLIQA